MHAWRRRVGNLIVHEVEREYVLLDGETDRIHRFNATASAIWRRLEEPGGVEAIARSLADEFDVDGEVALKDVRRTLDQMAALSLVVLEPEGTAARHERFFVGGEP